MLAAVLRRPLDKSRPRLRPRATLAVARRPWTPARHHAVQYCNNKRLAEGQCAASDEIILTQWTGRCSRRREWVFGAKLIIQQRFVLLKNCKEFNILYNIWSIKVCSL